ncbi:XrtA/PEP-CTERM system TPR-repeat protein PrsT [Thiobacillus sedimenti]|uniref:XrtA/PEP-CTERM system TPR-repeat protein PrsT n=1 Tax=Thiobacillus sedimenti TaxID=3110231 RepID=A0ABZ1CJE2_9PROT|nr:XrtA/PEP-CTERM system TPR-repeat protein PrsT [Thiobacillus sp. SCUT-2]WRS39511.1 XrtA/PEP-CTERM system TPR-repeat protein PrsT [Thiobacillus sp. SCUT-2]
MTSVPAARSLPALILAAGLLVACGGEDSAELLKDARAKLAAGDYKTATIELKNAVAKDERNAEARFELGKLYLAQLDLASAEKEFRRAREAGMAANVVNPMIARALLGQRAFQRVLDELPAAAGNDPDSITLQALRATAELGVGRKDDARKSLQHALQAAPDNADVHLALAQLALADKDPGQAMQELDETLRIDPRHRDSLLLKGDVLRTTGKPAEAAAVYREVLRLDPMHSGAHLALAGIAITENKLDDARQEVDSALKISPRSVQARYTRALIDFREKHTDRAHDEIASVLKAAPDYLPALLLGGSIEYALGNPQMAETYLNKVVAATPNNLYAVRMLAASQLRQGRMDDAASTLAPALRTAAQDPGVLIVAGEIALARKDFAKASAYFEEAAKRDPASAAIRTELGISRLAQGDSRAMTDLHAAAGMEGGSRAGTVIILSQLEDKQFDAALASIAALEKKQGPGAATWNYRGAAYLGKRDTARARDSFDQAVKLEPAFFPAAANLAQLDLADSQPANAAGRFESVLKADPKNLNAMLALADLGLRRRDEKTYVSWLEKAAAVHPQALAPRLALSRYLLAKGNRNKALAMAREAVDAHPDDPAALDLLGATQLALGDMPNAQGSYKKLVELQPRQPAPLAKLAAAQIAAKDLDGAARNLQDALRIQPDFLEAQLMLGGIEIQRTHFDSTLAIARQIQKQKPDSPAGFTLEGDAAYARKDYAGALSAYDRAQRLAPSGPLLIRELEVFTAAGRPEAGEKHLADWLATHPQDVRVRAALAESLLKRSQYRAASEQYLVLNKSAPDNLVVLNNLAWSLSEMNDGRALGYAEQALKLKPDNPTVMDTLGWILVQRGQTERGIKLLRQALTKAPDAGDIQYHYAAALAKSGDTARARLELDQLIKSGLDFSQKPAALSLMQTLNSR